MKGSRREVPRQLLHFQSAVFSALLVLLVTSVALWPRTEPASPEAPRLTFSEVARSAGIQATMRCGGPEKRWITEANGSGVAWLDYDNDGLMDLLIVNGAGMEELRKILGGEIPAATGPGVYLFHNLGNGRFEDVTARSGLTNPYWGTGANAADFDNDGYTDILITTIGRDLLYRNNHDGTFTEVGAAAGLSRDVAWHTGSAFGDFDGDGWLDLFVTGYIDINAVSFAEPAPVCDYLGKHTFCGPNGLKGGAAFSTTITATALFGTLPDKRAWRLGARAWLYGGCRRFQSGRQARLVCGQRFRSKLLALEPGQRHVQGSGSR